MPQSVWVKTGTLQWWCNWKPHKWVDVRVALEQFTGHDGARDSILFIYYVVHEEKKVRWGAPLGGGAEGRGRSKGGGCPGERGVPEGYTGVGAEPGGAGPGLGHQPQGARSGTGIWHLESAGPW